MGAIPASAGPAEGLASNRRPALTPPPDPPPAWGRELRSFRSGASWGRRAGRTLADLIQHQVDDDRHDRPGEKAQVAQLRIILRHPTQRNGIGLISEGYGGDDTCKHGDKAFPAAPAPVIKDFLRIPPAIEEEI